MAAGGEGTEQRFDAVPAQRARNRTLLGETFPAVLQRAGAAVLGRQAVCGGAGRALSRSSAVGIGLAASDYFAPMPNDADLLDLMLDWVPDEATRNKIFVDNPAQLFMGK